MRVTCDATRIVFLAYGRRIADAIKRGIAPALSDLNSLGQDMDKLELPKHAVTRRRDQLFVEAWQSWKAEQTKRGAAASQHAFARYMAARLTRYVTTPAFEAARRINAPRPEHADIFEILACNDWEALGPSRIRRLLRGF